MTDLKELTREVAEKLSTGRYPTKAGIEAIVLPALETAVRERNKLHTDEINLIVDAHVKTQAELTQLRNELEQARKDSEQLRLKCETIGKLLGHANGKPLEQRVVDMLSHKAALDGMAQGFIDHLENCTSGWPDDAMRVDLITRLQSGRIDTARHAEGGNS